MRVGSEGMSGQRCGGGEREKLLAQTQKGEKAGLAKRMGFEGRDGDRTRDLLDRANARDALF
jgi:hypothetical protein